MQNIQDLKEKIFFESKNMIAILDKISNVDELISRQDLVDELANRISFLKLLEKNLEYFENENFSSTEKNSENFLSQPFIESNYEVEEEEAIFNNQLNEIGENQEYRVTEEEAIFNNQLNEIVEEELHETLVNFVEENTDSETIISNDTQVDKDVFNEQLEEIDEHNIPENTDETLNFIDEERGLAFAKPENDDDIDENMFSREHTEEEAVFNNQLNEIDEFENEVSDDQGDLNDFDEEENIRNNFDSDIKNEEKTEITETIPGIFDTEPIDEDLLIEENEADFTVSEAMIEHGEMAADTSNVESIVTEIRHEAAVEEKQETILAEINDRRKIVEIDRPAPEKEKDKPASDESFENLEAYQQEKKIKLAHIKGLKAVQTLFDDDHLERTLPSEKTPPAEKKEDSGSILKTNIPTDFMEAEKKKPEFKLDLNDRIAFSKMLFGGSQSELNEVVNNLNSFRTLEEAKEYLSDLYYAKKWSKVDEYAQRLWILVENKFL
ncbi:ring-infected erythrocyte surface antigen domain-containing protein [Chryseobacterium takakiae]|uniref:Uncharacterized protein n=1 Tax=Chryseobacterium takakiae TaxID=1302685 RepID=A0A1M4YNJ2_9FLAO|nr:hypothetical protein [Chryseobacterium takakiae]SHF07228.1 hypothetical protein SAMN05444408_108128 [Chryseobacterium takakiae]